MEQLRKPFQGVWNIFRFNWPFYALFVIIVTGSLFICNLLNEDLQALIKLGCLFGTIATTISLIVSYYIYDRSTLYTLNWLDQYQIKTTSVLNIHSGFDETSSLLIRKFPTTHLTVYDFYDPVKHTEVSIRRARKSSPPFPDTIPISSTDLPAQADSTDTIFLIFSAHEIRNNQERALFFAELRRALKPNGKIVVVEHLRDLPNFLAYTFGFFHFHSSTTWLNTFSAAKLQIIAKNKITPFITIFILQKNDPSS